MAPHEVQTEEEFAKLTANDLCFVDFHAAWCGACKAFMPTFTALADDFTTVKFLKVDVDELEDVAGEQNVNGLPYLVIMQGGKQVASISGKDITKENVIEKLSKFATASGGGASAVTEDSSAGTKRPRVEKDSIEFEDASGTTIQFTVEKVLKASIGGKPAIAVDTLSAPTGNTLTFTGATGGVTLPKEYAADVVSKVASLAGEATAVKTGFSVDVPSIDVSYFSFADPKSGNILAFSVDMEDKKVRYTVNGQPRPSFRSVQSDGNTRLAMTDINKGCSLPVTNLHIHLASMKSLIKKIGGEAIGFPDVVTV